MLLLYVYGAAFMVGGVLLFTSHLLGRSDAGGVAQEDATSGGAVSGAKGEGEAARAQEEARVELGALWRPFVNVRFWILFLCCFGLTGTALTLLALAGKWTALFAAVGAGTGTGFFVVFSWRAP